MDKSTLQEIGAIWDKLNELEKKLSDFIDAKHEESMAKISDTEEALCDLDERISELSE